MFPEFKALRDRINPIEKIEKDTSSSLEKEDEVREVAAIKED